MKKLLHPIFFLYVFIILQMGYFFVVSTRPYSIAPVGKTYNILGKNFYYPSLIRQSRDGSWGIKDTHTTRDTPIVYAQLFFVGLGKAAALFHIDPVTMYQISRVLGALLGIGVLYWFCRKFLPPFYSFLAVVFAYGIETGPSLSTLVTFDLSKFLPAWDVQILYERRFSLPHHTWGEALGMVLFGIVFFSLIFPSSKKMKYLLPLIIFILAIMATTTLPSYVVVFTIASFPAVLYAFIKSKNISHFVRILLPMALGIGLSAIFMNHEFGKGMPWTNWTIDEKSWMQNNTVISQYLQTLTLYYPLLLIAIVTMLVRLRKITTPIFFVSILTAGWLIIPALLIPFTQYSFFPFANFRLVDATSYVPAGILSAIGLYELSKIISQKKIRRIVIGILVGTTMIISIALTAQFTKQVYASQENFWSVMYPTQKTWEGVLYMEQLPQESTVLVREFYGELLPAFGPVSVYIGGPHGFTDFLERRWLGDRFFSGTLSTAEAKQFLMTEHLTHVFWGPDEKSLTTTPLLYPTLLTPVFVNTDVTIFSVNK